MRAPAVLGMLAVLAGLSAGGCWVHRRSDGYTCNHDSDCASDRTCDRGYCVERGSDSGNGCPSACTSCDLDNQTCRIACGAGKLCGGVHCPAGFDCTIVCTGTAACGDIDCAGGRDCNIRCVGDGACRGIHCGDHACDVACSGVAACGDIDCASACRCDVQCGDTACQTTSCPDVVGAPCTQGGVAGASCDSTELPGCDTCF